MSGSRPRSRRFRAALILLGVTLLATAIAACGGSGSGAGSVAGSTAAADEFIVPSNDPVAESGDTTEIARAAYPTGRDTDEISPTGARAIEPCRLVSKAAATSILGKGTRVSEELQGPTCVYSAAGRQVTLVVEEASIKSLRQGARKASKVNVAGRQGWCLTYETTSVVVPFDRSRVLQVTGACQAGVRFAAVALRHRS